MENGATETYSFGPLRQTPKNEGGSGVVCLPQRTFIRCPQQRPIQNVFFSFCQFSQFLKEGLEAPRDRRLCVSCLQLGRLNRFGPTLVKDGGLKRIRTRMSGREKFFANFVELPQISPVTIPEINIPPKLVDHISVEFIEIFLRFPPTHQEHESVK